ncbi:GCN5 family acetyltransferase [Nocardioides sp. Soil797]|nr:GCN5 family acetyltransferase [Nocardioides sp. Soil797]
MTGELRVVAPRAEAAADISALALRSKAHWGYDEVFLEACRDELTFTAADCTSGDLFVGMLDSSLVGFVAVRGDGPGGELSALFVDPPWIGRGVGSRLLEHALGLAHGRGLVRLVLDADPGAEAFYLHHGARRIGESPSGSIPGRLLPRLEFRLDR